MASKELSEFREAVRQLATAGLATRDIAERTGKTRGAVADCMRKLRDRGLLPRPNRRQRLERVAALVNAGKTIAEIATALNMSKPYVRGTITRARDAGLLPPPARPHFQDVDTGHPRCRCGLRLPCAGHEPLGHVALSRPGEWL